MGLTELFFIAVGLSMDAFAVAACAGLTMPKVSAKKAVIIGLWFGGFQAAMPLIGYLAAVRFADMIDNYDHWIAFALLCFLGGKMIIGSFKKERPEECEFSPTFKRMLPLAAATSIDALAVGVSFAFLEVKMVPAISFIGVTTLVISAAGVKIGSVFGAKLERWAELAGGIILVLMGAKILLEHTIFANGI